MQVGYPPEMISRMSEAEVLGRLKAIATVKNGGREPADEERKVYRSKRRGKKGRTK